MKRVKNGYVLLIAVLLGVVLLVWLAISQSDVLLPVIKGNSSTENGIKVRTTEVQQQAEDYKQQVEKNYK